MANPFKEREKELKERGIKIPEHSLVNAGKTEEKTDTIVIVAEKAETRSKRVNLLVKPSVHEASLEKCKKLGISLNECVNQFLEKWSVE